MATADKEKFRALVEQYDLANGGLSVTQRKHPAFLALVAMGQPVVPLILLSIMGEPMVWLAIALREIVGGGPTIKDQDRGVLDKVREAWLKWGEEEGYIPSPDNMVLEISERLTDLSDEQIRAMYVVLKKGSPRLELLD
jgi:hypothetical protein